MPLSRAPSIDHCWLQPPVSSCWFAARSHGLLDSRASDAKPFAAVERTCAALLFMPVPPMVSVEGSVTLDQAPSATCSLMIELTEGNLQRSGAHSLATSHCSIRNTSSPVCNVENRTMQHHRERSDVLGICCRVHSS